MHQDLTQKLYDDFPELYRGRNRSPRESSMCYGFACDDGWFQIIYDMSADMMAIAQVENVAVPEVTQAKEKFGQLRFYLVDSGNDKIQQRIRQAEELSLNTCEICGAPGKRRHGPWVRTLCEEHADKDGSAS